MNKKCPMMNCAWNCTKEKCAWYLVHSKQCAVPLIASRLAPVTAYVKIFKTATRQVVGLAVGEKE